MWCFAWILGVGFAGTFSILNAMWLEHDETEAVRIANDVRRR